MQKKKTRIGSQWTENKGTWKKDKGYLVEVPEMETSMIDKAMVYGSLVVIIGFVLLGGVL